jgi:putative tryptophan/tyrosine transport system substrate-binding protein
VPVSRSLAEQERAIDAFAAEPNGGLIVLPAASTATRDNRQSILLLVARHRLPTIHWDRSYPAEGGLMSYGSDLSDLSRGAAGYVDRILRGSKVSDLSVQFPTKFEMVVNLKTARVLGLTIPETLLATEARLTASTTPQWWSYCSAESTARSAGWG